MIKEAVPLPDGKAVLPTNIVAGVDAVDARLFYHPDFSTSVCPARRDAERIPHPAPRLFLYIEVGWLLYKIAIAKRHFLLCIANFGIRSMCMPASGCMMSSIRKIWCRRSLSSCVTEASNCSTDTTVSVTEANTFASVIIDYQLITVKDC